jgi:hypothetical protein
VNVRGISAPPNVRLGPSYSSFCSMLSSDRFNMSSKLTELLFINVANSFRQQGFAVPLRLSNIYRNRIRYRLRNIEQMIHICVSTINRLTDSHAPWMGTQCYRQRFNISSLLAIYDWWPTRARLMAIAAIREGPSQVCWSSRRWREFWICTSCG